MSMTIVQYTQQANDSFAECPLTEGDMLVLCQLAYMNLGDYAGHRLQEVRELAGDTIDTVVGDVHYDTYLSLIEALAEGERLGQVWLLGQQTVFDPANSCQFSATVFDCGTHLVLACRGTDGTLVGWKEDLDLLYKDSLASHRLAVDMLQQYAAKSRKPLVVAGHSKGGNIAVYAATMCRVNVQRRIAAVYNFDGPGFLADMYERPAYLHIADRIHKFVPEFCVFGTMLNAEQPYMVVVSDADGIWQHFAFNWQMQQDGSLIRSTEGLCRTAILLREIIDNMLPTMPESERVLFVDTVYEAMRSADVNVIGDIKKRDTIAKAHKFIRSQPKEVQATLWKLLFRLIAVSASTGLELTGERLAQAVRQRLCREDEAAAAATDAVSAPIVGQKADVDTDITTDVGDTDK